MATGLLSAAGLVALAHGGARAAWEPTAPVEIVVPAGSGGGADQMARLIQAIVAKHGLMKQPIGVVNKPGNSGADALLDIKASRGNPHKLVVTLSNVFTTPLATGVAFNWRDITPVSMMALDQFVLWVHADSPYRQPRDFVAAVHAKPGSIKLGGTGSKQEDQLISVLLEHAADGRITYVPLSSGGDVAKALAERQVDATVNNPIEAEPLWRTGLLRPLCVFDAVRLDFPAKLFNGASWADIPTCVSAGIPVQYLMLRGIFTTPGATLDQVAYYRQVLDKVRTLPEWRNYAARGALKPTAVSGHDFVEWLERGESFHRMLMREAKLSVK